MPPGRRRRKRNTRVVDLRTRAKNFDITTPVQRAVREISLDERSSQLDLTILTTLRTLRLRDIATYTLLATLAAGSIASIVLFFLEGFGVTNLTDTEMLALSGATIAEIGGLLTIVLRSLFSQPTR